MASSQWTLFLASHQQLLQWMQSVEQELGGALPPQVGLKEKASLLERLRGVQSDVEAKAPPLSRLMEQALELHEKTGDQTFGPEARGELSAKYSDISASVKRCVDAWRLQGCFECCIKCLGGVPYASLVATILCFIGVALFCGCGHVALSGTLTMLDNHFSTVTTDHATLTMVIQIFQYIIYGIASFFFVYAILLLAEGFYTTSAIKKELQSDFKTTACGRCITAFFMFLTYIMFLAFLAIFGFTAIPVFLFFNMWTTCSAMRSPDANITSPDSICVDVRQYGELPHIHSFIFSVCH
ncbi:neuronal membrane glycoprotein M6-b-like [Notothenia coriiceps]|uniref:Neuronal membrane glycoprotein M6-b-like n=1 Tax=Notothenia coriiceps TaxID=8208 RepID=A0A6I9NV43_9TELE|nr:PREDICTED: neuronal membrane glycoprotein M6-b-like [Notothenia coriiceps]